MTRFFSQSRLALWILLLLFMWLVLHAARALFLAAAWSFGELMLAGQRITLTGYHLLVAFAASVALAWFRERRISAREREQLTEVFE